MKRRDQPLILGSQQITGTTFEVGELAPDSPQETLSANFTLKTVVAKARAGGRSAPVGIGGTKLNP